ncbi:hypothetical protein [Bradyrhizobium sp.]|uniref:hypothetical protein n=1 Tax=Bradyrhizobium sp. TaxID=376 RepID=UPI003C63116D
MADFPQLVRTPEALKEARKVLGLSAGGLARMLRVEDDRAIRRWETPGATVPGPVTVVMETAMSYLSKRQIISQQLDMMRSGKMRTGFTDLQQGTVDDTAESIAHLEAADADYEAALRILMQVDGNLGNGLEALTLQPNANEPAREVHWYHLWRQTPKHVEGEKDDWSLPNEVSPEAALAYFERHEAGFSEGLSRCADPHDLSAEFILEQREVLRTPRGNSVSLRAGRLVDSFAVRRGRASSHASSNEDAQPFKTIRLNRLAPGSNGGNRELRSLQSAIAYVREQVAADSSRRSELHWIVAITALINSSRTADGFGHARDALAEALRSEGWMSD